MIFVTFQSGSREKPERVRGALNQPILNTPCCGQSTGWECGYPSHRTAPEVPLSSQQDQLQPSLWEFSCDRIGSRPPASWHAFARLCGRIWPAMG